MLKYVATGCGHSGTGYVANLLRSGGINCGHEGVFNSKGLWFDPPRFEAESSWVAAVHLGHPAVETAKVIHVVRNPVDVIKSHVRAGWNEQNEKWIRKKVDHPLGRFAFDFACDFWLRWNEKIEQSGRADYRFCVEDRTFLLEMLGLEALDDWDNPEYNSHPREQLTTKTPNVQVRCRSGIHYESVTWGTLPPAVQEMGQRYGYGP